MGFQGRVEKGHFKMKINTQIQPGSDFPSVKPLESQRTEKENWNLLKVYKNKEFYVKMKRLPITQDFNGASKSNCKCHGNLGWVATHDCASNNSITVRFGNSLEVGQGAGPRRIPIYFWCHGAEQVVAEERYFLCFLVRLLIKTSKQTPPPPEKWNHLTNKRLTSGSVSDGAALLTQTFLERQNLFFRCAKSPFLWWICCSCF